MKNEVLKYEQAELSYLGSGLSWAPSLEESIRISGTIQNLQEPLRIYKDFKESLNICMKIIKIHQHVL